MRIDRIVIEKEIRLIENVKISSQDDLIYIYANEGADENKISGLYIYDVADFLVDSGWFGQQIMLELCGESESDEHRSQSIRNRLNTSVEWRVASITKMSQGIRNEMDTDVSLNIASFAKMSRLEDNYKQFLHSWLYRSRYVYPGTVGSSIIKGDSE